MQIKPTIQEHSLTQFGLALVLGLASRLAFAIWSPPNFDQESYAIVVDVMRAGGNVYAETTRYNYSPVWAWVLLGLSYLPFPLAVSVRGFLSVVDCANAFVIGRTAGRRAGVVYALNPVAILLVGWHGQFETLAALPLLLALAYPQRSWLLGTASVVIKHLFIFQVWMLFVVRMGWRAVPAIAATSAVFVLSFLPALPDGADGIVTNVLLYRSIPHGLGLVAPQAAFLLFITTLTALPLVMRWGEATVPHALAVSGAALVALIPGFGQQYLLIPILLIHGSFDWYYRLYTGLATAALVGELAGISGARQLWLLACGVALVWVLRHVSIVVDTRRTEQVRSR